jgi:hypothetical protein
MVGNQERGRHSAVGRQDKEKDGCDRDGRSDSSPFDGKELNEATSAIGEPIIGSARQPKYFDTKQIRC